MAENLGPKVLFLKQSGERWHTGHYKVMCGCSHQVSGDIVSLFTFCRLNIPQTHPVVSRTSAQLSPICKHNNRSSCSMHCHHLKINNFTHFYFNIHKIINEVLTCTFPYPLIGLCVNLTIRKHHERLFGPTRADS